MPNYLCIFTVVCLIKLNYETQNNFIHNIFIHFFNKSGRTIKKNILELSSNHKNRLDFSLYQDLILPSVDFEKWESEYQKILKDFNPKDEYSICLYQVYSKLHVRLDSSTIICGSKELSGIWRMVLEREFLIVDSISYKGHSITRYDSIISSNETIEDAFAVFTNNRFKEYIKYYGKTKYKKSNYKYHLVEGKYIELSKFWFVFGMTYFIGIDDKGILVLEYASSKEKNYTNNYKLIKADIEQMNFEKVE